EIGTCVLRLGPPQAMCHKPLRLTACLQWLRDLPARHALAIFRCSRFFVMAIVVLPALAFFAPSLYQSPSRTLFFVTPRISFLQPRNTSSVISSDRPSHESPSSGSRPMPCPSSCSRIVNCACELSPGSHATLSVRCGMG